MRTPNKPLLSIDTLVLAAAGVWAAFVMFSLLA
jgi:hypothetical protein